jgi:hypothetical protein
MFANRKVSIGKLTFLLCLFLNACTEMATGPASMRTPRPPALPMPEITTPTYLPAISLPQPSLTVVSSLQSMPEFTSTPLLPTDAHTVRVPTDTVPPDSQSMLSDQAFELHATEIASYSPTCDKYSQYDVSISPSGNWLAIRCGYSQNQTLEIDSKSGKRWVLQIKDFLPEQFLVKGEFEGYGSLSPAHWTNDEKFLYFTSYLGFDGGGTCFYGFGDDGLFRINLKDGTITTTLPESAWGAGYETIFSPGGRQLAYAYNSKHLTIIDLKTGEESIIEVGKDYVGNLTWSPDGLGLAYAACQPTQDGLEIEKSSVKIFSLESHNSKTILEVTKTFLSIESHSENQFLISNDDFQAKKADILLYDWFSGRPATPTPTPGPR